MNKTCPHCKMDYTRKTAQKYCDKDCYKVKMMSRPFEDTFELKPFYSARIDKLYKKNNTPEPDYRYG